MLRYLTRRVLWIPPTLLGITLLVFCAIRLAPGDPATVMIGLSGGGELDGGGDYEARVRAFRTRHALDRSLLVQYLGFLGPFNVEPDGHPWFGGSGRDPWGGLLLLDLGHEYQRSSVPIVEELGRRLRVTLPLALVSSLLVYLLALPAGIVAALRAGTRLDLVLSLFLFLLFSVPTFWMGLLLVLLLGPSGLDWFPILGLHDKDAAQLDGWAYAWDTLWHAVLPVATLTYGGLAYLSRQMRVGLLEVLHSDFVRTARAKGLPERMVILKHALRNALLPVITLFASILPLLIGGSLVVEVVFDLPGMGRYAFEGLVARDYGVIMATTTLSACLTLVGILLADVCYAVVDPRIRYD